MYTRRWLISFPFLVALAVIIFMTWTAYFVFNFPYDGIPVLSLDGVVEVIAADSPAVNVLRTGDKILSIDGIAFKTGTNLASGHKSGDTLSIRVQHGTITKTVAMTLAHPTVSEQASRLSPLIVALAFWVIGLGVQAFKPSQESTNIFFLFFNTTAFLLTSGAASSVGSAWATILYRLAMWVIGPLTVHFHLHFPQTTRLPRQKWFLTGLYATAIISGLVYSWIARQGYPYTVSALEAPLQIASRILLTGSLLLVVWLLFLSYRNATTSGVRSKIRLVVLGGALSLIPITTLILIPDLLELPILPFSALFIFLSILPLTYGFAIFRYRLIEIEKHVNRGATYILVYSVLVVFYLVFSAGLQNILQDRENLTPIFNTLVVLVLVSIFIPLHRYIQRLVDTAFYGGWYDYRSAISEITQGLEQITELQTLAGTVSERLVGTLRLEDVCVFLADPSGDFSTLAVAPQPVPPGGRRTRFSPLPRSSLTYLLNMGGVVERNVLREALAGATISAQEMQLLESEQVYLWVPIIGHGNILGLLALGPKFGGDVFSGEDMDILRVVSRHMAPLIENIHLVSRLRGYAAELEQRVAERTEELSASKERVETILASVGEGVIVTDLEGDIQIANMAFLAQSGWRESELVGQSFWECYEIDNIKNLPADVRFAVEQNAIWSGELVSFRKDGGRYDVQLTVAPLRDASGTITGYVGSQRDITHQKELNRLKDMFVSDVSHELRTPTTNIGLYLDLLDTAPDEKRSHYLKVLKDQSRLLIKLVEDILDLSRLATGKHRKIEFDYMDLNMIAEQVILAHTPQAQAAGLELIFEPDEELQPVMGEFNQLSRLVNNLVSNAIHYTMRGKVFIQTEQDGDSVILKVRDTGMGIDAEDLPHLFDRFYRGRRVRQSRIHGTGLGLAIVKEIVDMHASSITIESVVDEGSTFNVRFPVATGEPWLVKLS
jgi:two-component system NtrC family sensor kinase